VPEVDRVSGPQFGTMLPSVDGLAGTPSVVSSLNRNPAIRSSSPPGAGRPDLSFPLHLACAQIRAQTPGNRFVEGVPGSSRASALNALGALDRLAYLLDEDAVAPLPARAPAARGPQRLELERQGRARRGRRSPRRCSSARRRDQRLALRHRVVGDDLPLGIAQEERAIVAAVRAEPATNARGARAIQGTWCGINVVPVAMEKTLHLRGNRQLDQIKCLTPFVPNAQIGGLASPLTLVGRRETLVVTQGAVSSGTKHLFGRRSSAPGSGRAACSARPLRDGAAFTEVKGGARCVGPSPPSAAWHS
jgi:hypothetical protein